jgi:CubicO group peptidase (beta-lactamase class C family)
MAGIRYVALFAVLFLNLTAFSVRSFSKSIGTNEKAYVKVEHLSETALANHFIWVAGEIEEIEEEWIDHNLVGGVLLEQPAENIDFPSHISVALRIDETLKIFYNVSDQISLKTLLAIEDKALRLQFYSWLQVKSKSIGYDHLVLPLGNSSNDEYLTLFKEMLAIDSTFFIAGSQLSVNYATKRKKFYEKDTFSGIRIIEAQDFGRYEKTLKKGPRKKDSDILKVRKHLEYLQKPPDFEQLNHAEMLSLFRRIWSESIVPIQVEDHVFPIKNDTVALWTTNSEFASHMKRYFNTVQNVQYDHISPNAEVIIDGREQPMIALEKALELSSHPIIWIGDLNLLPGLQPKGVLFTEGNHAALDHILPEMLYGSEPIIGRFNLTGPSYLSDYSFHPVAKQKLLGFSDPEWMKMDLELLDSIDFLAEEMITEHASPGAQVLVAKEGKIVLQKSYGFLTYDSLMPVQHHTLYDLASLTKVTATLLAAMKLNQEKKLLLDGTLGYYLPEYQSTNKSNITIRQLLAHQSGLKSYLPFWKRSLKGDFVDVFYYKSKADAENDKRSYGYQPDPVMLDSLMEWIQRSPLIADANTTYKYSDIGFMILHQVIESITGQPIDDFLSDNFYEPLGMYATCFNPLNKGVELYDIAPTEYDYYFRDEQVWGQVHDRNAAVFGGVAGHAGLFSNAKDLALLLQMLLQDGIYRDRQFVSRATLGTFNEQYFANNRRGLGWDKPGVYNPNISKLASENSFGHTGFTGTMVWVDPDEELIFIFLSNRIFPDSNNKTLITLDTRRRMHDLVYRSIGRR